LKDDNILMVEDNPDDALLMMRALRKSGVGNEVVVARDGAEALDHLLEPGSLPKLVLLDLRLPKLDGLAVLERLRGHDRTRRLPVVLLTSCEGEREALIGAGGADADFYLPKSMEFGRFLRDVRRIIGPLLTDTCLGPILKSGATARSSPAHRRTALECGSTPRTPALARYSA
jgi:two-component system response regulator